MRNTEVVERILLKHFQETGCESMDWIQLVKDGAALL
jgi:hypothetical protein